MIRLKDMGLEEEWLSQILGEGTRKHYARALRYLLKFLELDTCEELKNFAQKEKHFETRVVQFYQWLQETKGLTSNSARSNIIPVQSYFSYIGLPLKLKHKLPKLHGKIENWKPTLEDLQKIYNLGDISVKCWMTLSRDIPGRMGDMLKITPEHIESGEFQLLSAKEGVLGKCYVSEQTRILFRQLKASGLTLPTTPRGIDLLMNRACHVAGMPQRLNQHLWRKIFISTAINLGISDIIWKLLTFKTIPLEQSTYYLNSSELRPYWEKIIDAIPLEPKNGRITDLQKNYDELESVMKVLARYIAQSMKKDRSYKQPPQDLKTLEDYVEKRP
jgi:hypothetical protein